MVAFFEWWRMSPSTTTFTLTPPETNASRSLSIFGTGPLFYQMHHDWLVAKLSKQPSVCACFFQYYEKRASQSLYDSSSYLGLVPVCKAHDLWGFRPSSVKNWDNSLSFAAWLTDASVASDVRDYLRIQVPVQAADEYVNPPLETQEEAAERDAEKIVGAHTLDVLAQCHVAAAVAQAAALSAPAAAPSAAAPAPSASTDPLGTVDDVRIIRDLYYSGFSYYYFLFHYIFFSSYARIIF